MHNSRPSHVATVAPRGEASRFQLVFHVGDGLWARWGTHDLRSLDSSSRESTIGDRWATFDDWFSVDVNPCSECGHYQALCYLCRTNARHFLEAEWLVPELYLCDRCVRPFSNYLEDDPMVRWERAELGAYACCDGCTCDTW